MQVCGLGLSGERERERERERAVAGFCEHGDDVIVAHDVVNFVDSVTGYQMLKK
jgi:hypothetical protein